MLVRRSRLLAAEAELRKTKKALKKTDRQFKKATARFTERLIEAEQQKVDLRTEVAVLKERLDLIANYLPGDPSDKPLYTSEEEEDINYAYESGQIDHGEYEELLRDAGLLTTEIDIDSAGIPHIV